MTSTILRNSLHPSVSARTPFDNDDFFDESQLRDLRAYARPLKRVRLVERIVDTALLAVLTFVLDIWPDVADLAGGQGWAVRLAVVILVLNLLATVTSLPVSYWASMVHDKRHGVSNMTMGTFVGDQLKGIVVNTLLFWLLFTPLLAAIHSFDNWWLIGGVAIFVVQVFFAFAYPVLIMPRFNKFEPMPEGEVRTRIEDIADLAGVSIEGVYTMDGSKRSRRGNAFVAGFGPTKRVVVFDTVMDMPLPRLSQIIAHEIGHYRLKHITQSFPVAAAQFLVALAVIQLIGTNDTVLGWASVESLGDPAALPLFLTLFAIPMTGLGLVSSWLSRRHEREADLEALELLTDPTSFVALWPDLVELNKADLEPGWWDKLNASHPEIGERMQFGADWAAMNGIAYEPPAKAAVPPPTTESAAG